MKNEIRLDHELPLAVVEWGWKYHHLGTPTDKVMLDETYLALFRLYVSGFETSPFGIEWMRYEKDSPIHPLIQEVPHICFEVENLDYELSIHDFNIITLPNSPSKGTRVAMIEHDGAPMELIEFRNKKDSNKKNKIRLDHELPLAIGEWGWKYHHLGIPTNKVLPDERYLPQFKLYVSGFDTSPFGVEWMRYEKDSPISAITKSVPHIAFEVDDIDLEFAKHNFEIISEPGIPSDGVRAAMILHNGAPIELIEFRNKI